VVLNLKNMLEARVRREILRI